MICALTAARVRKLLVYDPLTGNLTNRVTRSSRAQVGDSAGGPHNQGYLAICIDRKRYLAHRLAWVYMTGEWPGDQVDHRDGNRANNAWANLRDCSGNINQQNRRRARKDNKLGLLGVRKHRGLFMARIQKQGSHAFLGYYATPEEAHEAYVRAKRILHPGCTL